MPWLAPNWQSLSSRSAFFAVMFPEKRKLAMIAAAGMNIFSAVVGLMIH